MTYLEKIKDHGNGGVQCGGGGALGVQRLFDLQYFNNSANSGGKKMFKTRRSTRERVWFGSPGMPGITIGKYWGNNRQTNGMERFMVAPEAVRRVWKQQVREARKIFKLL